MASLKIIVHDKPSTDIIHRFQNFGEDVWRRLKDEADISLEEIDASTTFFFIHGVKSKKINRTIKIIYDLLSKHGFENTGEVIRS